MISDTTDWCAFPYPTASELPIARAAQCDSVNWRISVNPCPMAIDAAVVVDGLRLYPSFTPLPYGLTPADIDYQVDDWRDTNVYPRSTVVYMPRRNVHRAKSAATKVERELVDLLNRRDNAFSMAVASDDCDEKAYWMKQYTDLAWEWCKRTVPKIKAA